MKLGPFDIYKFLPQTNCKRCGLPGCIAFCGSVIGGQKKLGDCPYLSAEDIEKISPMLADETKPEDRQAEFIEKLRKKIGEIDLTIVANERGAVFRNGYVSIRSLGKMFHIDSKGDMTSDCHIIPWVQAPLLSYLCHPRHHGITNRWISFREIKGGIEWRGLFTSRCETPLKLLADRHPSLLSDIVELFSGKEVPGFKADIALVLYPLPHIPICICYQEADSDLESELNIFFDECCGTNLHVKSIYTLCAGLVKMFEQIAIHHH